MNQLEDPEDDATPEEIDLSKEARNADIVELKERCTKAGIELVEVESWPDEPTAFRLNIKSGREARSIFLGTARRVSEILSIEFEKYTFISGYDAIVSYPDDSIEAYIRAIDGPASSRQILAELPLTIEPPRPEWPRIQIGPASADFRILLYPRLPSRVLSIKLTGGKVTRHDHALTQLRKTADALFFQIDMLSGVALNLIRQR